MALREGWAGKLPLSLISFPGGNPYYLIDELASYTIKIISKSMKIKPFFYPSPFAPMARKNRLMVHAPGDRLFIQDSFFTTYNITIIIGNVNTYYRDCKEILGQDKFVWN
jgi:hypothetical protein